MLSSIRSVALGRERALRLNMVETHTDHIRISTMGLRRKVSQQVGDCLESCHRCRCLWSIRRHSGHHYDKRGKWPGSSESLGDFSTNQGN